MSISSKSPLLRAIAGQKPVPSPVWLMRQAGRYLPEYKETRAQAGDFLSLCYNSDLAAEVTLQPIRRFGFDAAILFADILLIPDALGQDVRFVAGEGPRLAPIRTEGDLKALSMDNMETHLQPVADTVSKTRAGLGEETTLIGFAGAPWTVLTYMLEGQGSKDHFNSRKFAYQNPKIFDALLELVSEATLHYLKMQVRAGAQVIKLFDSWAGSATAQGFDDWVIKPAQFIFDGLRKDFPDLPIIGFPRGAGEKLPHYVEQTGVNAVAIDYSMDPKWADENLPKGLCVQGNLDPALLVGGGDALDNAVDDILQAFEDRPHIFNLGHGIVPETPIAHVEQLLKRIRGS